MKRIRFFVFAFIVLGVGVFLYILISTMLNARNQAPRVREQQLVYDIWAFAEEQYRDVFYPQSVDTIYLIGGVKNALVAKLTEVYFLADRYGIQSRYECFGQPLDRGD